MSQNLANRCIRLVETLGLARAADVSDVRPLTGGVASDIARVALSDRPVCVKFALDKLKVAEEWRAPVHRNGAEYAWLGFARSVSPLNAPRLFGHSDALNGFAMEYLQGDDTYSWKTALMAASPPRGEAEKVAVLLGRLHAASSRPGFDRGPFDNHDDLMALRLEPYLSFTASRHPDLAARIGGLVDAHYRADRVLIHGDVSPKNILIRGTEPVLLDAECATMGDASFDLAFCLNHLILKAVHVPGLRAELLDEIRLFWRAYAPHVDWEDVSALEARTTSLIPALMLARVDGKSPVEYLTGAERTLVRNLSKPLILSPPATLDALLASLGQQAGWR